MAFRIFRALSILLTLATTASTVVVSLKWFDEKIEDGEIIRHACTTELRPKCAMIDWDLACFDKACACFFIIEFLLRTYAVGWRQPISFTGLTELLALGALLATVGPSRTFLMHPTAGEAATR